MNKAQQIYDAYLPELTTYQNTIETNFSELCFYAVLTGKLTRLMELLLPENRSSELLHPGWRGIFLVAEKPLQEEKQMTPHLHWHLNAGNQFLERSSAILLCRPVVCDAETGGIPPQKISRIAVAS